MITIFFTAENRPEQGTTFSGERVVLGRPGGKPVDLDLSFDDKVSRQQAEFFYYQNSWWVKDLGSRHGTYLNGQLLKEDTALKPEDRLRVGATTLRVEFEEIIAPASRSKEKFQTAPEVDNSMVEDGFTLLDTYSSGSGETLELVEKVVESALTSRDPWTLLERVMAALAAKFPGFERGSIALLEDGNLVPKIYRPADRSYLSFTWAEKALRWQQTLRVQPETVDFDPVRSVFGTFTGLYAPLVFNAKPLGLLHIDLKNSGGESAKKAARNLSLLAGIVSLALKSQDLARLPRPPRLFLSYAREDALWASNLAADLRRCGIRIWQDKTAIPPGENWSDHIKQAVQDSDGLIFILSPEGVASPYTRQEWSLALETDRPIFPVLCRECATPTPLELIQRVRLDGPDYAQGFDRLVKRLREMVP